MLIVGCLELKANANLLIYLWGELQGMMGAEAIMTWSTFPSLLGRWVCPQAIHRSFGVMREAGTARQRDGSRERVMMRATALWAPTHTPSRAPITLPLINRANPSKCGVCGQMCVCVWTDLQTHTYIHSRDCRQAQLGSLLHLQTNFPHWAPETGKDIDYLLH